ncbi:MAG: FAD-dependent oxidoreductase, partial [Novosphingobium sp.]|nr:FAD-dependent oxidoreductase [Novosphingobium sp.]
MTSPRIVIIGGGIIGSLTARALSREGMTDVTVIERDPTYQFSST